MLSGIYYQGKYIKRDIKKSIYYLTLVESLGHANAQFVFGSIYYESVDIPQDITKSVYYLTQADRYFV